MAITQSARIHGAWLPYEQNSVRLGFDRDNEASRIQMPERLDAVL
jgi:hypothetical protein